MNTYYFSYKLEANPSKLHYQKVEADSQLNAHQILWGDLCLHHGITFCDIKLIDKLTNITNH